MAQKCAATRWGSYSMEEIRLPADPAVLPWNLLPDYVTEQQLQTLVEVALHHLPHAFASTRSLAQEVFSTIRVPGFRTFDHLPPRLAQLQLTQAFRQSQLMAATIVGLWLQARLDLLAELQRRTEALSEERKLHWTLDIGVIGFKPIDTTSALYKAAVDLATRKPEKEAGEIWLAAYVLSCAMAPASETEPITAETGQGASQSTIDTVAASTEENIDLQDSDTATPIGQEVADAEIIRRSATDLISANVSSTIDKDVAKIEREETVSDVLFGSNTVQLDGIGQRGEMPEAVALEEKVTVMSEVLKEGLTTPDDFIERLSLGEVRRQIETRQRAMNTARQATQVAARGLQSAVDDQNPSQVENLLTAVQSAANKWITTHNDLRTTVQKACKRLHMELQLRPDLDRDGDLLPQIEAAHQADTVIPNHLSEILRIVDLISNYDKTREALWGDLEKLHESMSLLLDKLAAWSDGDLYEEDANPGLWPDLREAQLDTLKLTWSQAKAQYELLQSRLSQIRELRINRVIALAQALRQHEIVPAPQITSHLTLDDIVVEPLKGLTGQEVTKIERRLTDLQNEQTLYMRESIVYELAAELKDEWHDDRLADMIERLARQRRDVEALLLLLAANDAHARTEMLDLSKIAVDGLLRAIGQLSEKVAPFELIALVAPDFLSGWLPSDVTAQVKLNMLFLAAHYGGGYKLPSGFLWQLPNEWPLETMPSWGTLWQAALLDEPRPEIQLTPQTEVEMRLQQAKQVAMALLARDAGSFVHLRSLRSRRHITMLSNRLMPGLAAKLIGLQKVEQDLLDRFGTSTLRGLERLVVEMENEFADKELVGQYESGISAEGINDSDSFHRRTALRAFQDCTEGLLSYGRVLLEYAYWRNRGDARVSRVKLEQELAALPATSAFESAVLEQVCVEVIPDRQDRDDSMAQALAQRKITKKLLTDAAYAIRIPHTISYVTGAPLSWNKVLDPLLSDLCEPTDPETAARILIEHEAPNQALLLIKNDISLEKQNQAQQLLDRKTRTVSELQAELFRLGSTAEDMNEDRQLGRWRFVQQELTTRLEEHRATREQGKRTSQQRATQLRRTINELDDKVFNVADAIPSEARRSIERGLALARQGTNDPALLPGVETYIREIKYRLDHNSWPLLELQNAADQLERSISGATDLSQNTLTSDEVIQLLDHGEIKRLGLSPDTLSSSEISTRIDVLRHWGRVRLLPTVESEELRSTDRSAIQTLYQTFAQMVTMKYYRRGGDKPIIVEHPSVYSWYELTYPKTDALEPYCVLLALPGNPPSSNDIKWIQNLVDDRKWLEEGFVLLFVPGCTPKIADRFRSNFRNQRLVILDEPAMLSIVLAEAETKTPLGRLRALMLNAHGAAEVDIYKINQPVDPRTAIFVGRDALVDRIALSGNNYAVYGGRRIGKSSVLKAIEKRLASKDTKTIYFSFEGHNDYSDDATAFMIAKLMRTRLVMETPEIKTVDDFQIGMQTYLELNPTASLALLLDEIDRYIESNPHRHVFIETLRALSDRFTNRFRVVIAGFMHLYDCMQGRGPYSPTSDPWRRMLNDIGPLDNLKASQAERIVTEGFLDILGWKFEHRAIPQLIVERTGGHPAFVQHFCERLQRRTASRQDQTVRISDVEAVFADQDPNHSFIAYVKYTFEMNLQDPISRFLILWLASESSQARSFTLDQIRELARLSKTPIPEKYLLRSLDTLAVNSVVKEFTKHVYEFTVPDYPLILERLGQTHMDPTKLEQEITEYLGKANGFKR